MVNSSVPQARQWVSNSVKVWFSVGSQAFFALLLIASLLASCQENPTPIATGVPIAPVTGLRTALLDTVTNLPNGQITWSTYWRLCWEPYPGAQAYEMQTATDEGVSPKLRRLTTACYRLQVAAGRNAKSQGFLNRKQLLDLQAGQLSFKIRAVLHSGQVSEWSAPTRLEPTTAAATTP